MQQEINSHVHNVPHAERYDVLFYNAGVSTALTAQWQTICRRCSRIINRTSLSHSREIAIDKWGRKIAFLIRTRLLLDFMTHFAAQVDFNQVKQAAGHEVGRVDQVRQQLQRTSVIEF